MDFELIPRSVSDLKKPGFNLMDDLKRAFGFLLGKQSIVSKFGIFITLNFTTSLSLSVPLPYIVNQVLKLDSGSFGIIQGALPAGAIVGALLIGRLSKKVDYPTILKASSIALSICFAMVGAPLLPNSTVFGPKGYVLYFSVIMAAAGLTICFIDIPIIYLLQIEIPDELRGRVMSIGMSLVKTVVPVALLISGLLVNITPPFVLPAAGGLMLSAYVLLAGKSLDRGAKTDKMN